MRQVFLLAFALVLVYTSVGKASAMPGEKAETFEAEEHPKDSRVNEATANGFHLTKRRSNDSGVLQQQRILESRRRQKESSNLTVEQLFDQLGLDKSFLEKEGLNPNMTVKDTDMNKLKLAINNSLLKLNLGVDLDPVIKLVDTLLDGLVGEDGVVPAVLELLVQLLKGLLGGQGLGGIVNVLLGSLGGILG